VQAPVPGENSIRAQTCSICGRSVRRGRLGGGTKLLSWALVASKFGPVGSVVKTETTADRSEADCLAVTGECNYAAWRS
jgi:hypothetical protein